MGKSFFSRVNKSANQNLKKKRACITSLAFFKKKGIMQIHCFFKKGYLKIMENQILSKDDMTITKIDMRCVKMGNELIQAAHGLTLAKKRIMSIAASNIKGHKPKYSAFNPSAFTFEVTAEEYSRVCNIDLSESYKQLKKASLDLLNDQIERKVYDAQGNPVIVRGKQQLERFVWVQHVKYCEGEGKVIITFSERVTDFLTGLHKNFTRYLLEQSCKLTSYYAIRFFEMLMQFKNTGWFHISVEDFCDQMNAPKSCRDRFQQIKTRIIAAAVKQLRNDWIITYEVESKGKGKKITHLKFKFKENKQTSLALA
jgi:plasmid replication initiation protein